MRKSFDDNESFKETVESLRFNNAHQQNGSSNSTSMPLEGNIIPSDPIILRRVGSTSSLNIQEARRSGIVFNNPSRNLGM